MDKKIWVLVCEGNLIMFSIHTGEALSCCIFIFLPACVQLYEVHFDFSHLSDNTAWSEAGTHRMFINTMSFTWKT